MRRTGFFSPAPGCEVSFPWVEVPDNISRPEVPAILRERRAGPVFRGPLIHPSMDESGPETGKTRFPVSSHYQRPAAVDTGGTSLRGRKA